MKRNPKLRVKIKSLAEEAKIIRVEERRANQAGDYYLQSSLREHRVGIVRDVSRQTLIAYQYLRGIPYKHCGQAIQDGDKGPVEKMIKRYGSLRHTDLDQWLNEEHLAQAA